MVTKLDEHQHPTLSQHSPKNNSPFPSVSFLSSLRGCSKAFVPDLCLLVQSTGSPVEKTLMRRVLPVISNGAWFESKSPSWPSEHKSRAWKTKLRSFYGNLGLYSKCIWVQRFTGNFQGSSQAIKIKSTVTQPVWPLCPRLKMVRISFEQCWSPQVHQAYEVKCSPRESQSLMSRSYSKDAFRPMCSEKCVV